uniref:Adenylate kinase active site lid domain-containing protein n=1 Tax=Peronospora matthiolae TaxID=2874970 RepID=A0AAV1TEI4_9STRA
MDSGALVTDDIVVNFIKDAIKSSECRCGFVLDDFPRAVVQAKKGPRVHLASGRSNHVKFAPPDVDGKDDTTGEPLIQRKEDNKATLGSRLEEFYKETQPVIDFTVSRENWWK